MAWANLYKYLDNEGASLVGAASEYYWEPSTYGTMPPPYELRPIVSIDSGCGPTPYIMYIPEATTYDDYRFGPTPFTTEDSPAVLVNNNEPSYSSTTRRLIGLEGSYLGDVSTIRARMVLRGAWSSENYNHAALRLGWGPSSAPVFTIGEMFYPSGFDNETVTEWYEFELGDDRRDYLWFEVLSSGCVGSFGPFALEIEYLVPEPPPPGFRVYELDKGWSFDGHYIPHFIELNWYFGDDPFTSKSIQKVRIHGLTKGLAQLQLSVAGMQTEYDSDYTEPQFISLPRNAVHISSEYIPVTNYVDSSNWGLSLQLKFEGSNTDLNKPEPSHVLQVLALQGSPQENGKRNN